jgi:uncharacterized protein (DUF697 family)
MTPDEKADKVIAGLLASAAAAAAIPLPLTVPFMAVVAGGVVAIGSCYGVTLTKADAWKLIREFFKAAGFVWGAANVGGVVISWVLAVTGAGYPVAVTLDAATGMTVAYAIGHAAKHYFRGETSKDQIRAAMRDAVRQAKAARSASVGGSND